MAKWLSIFTVLILVFIALGQNKHVIQAGQATATAAATEEAIPLGNGWILTSKVSTDESSDPKLSIEIAQPVLTGPTDPRIDHFNKAVEDLVSKAVSSFKKDLADLGRPKGTIEPPLPGSFIGVSYTVFLATADLISIRFDINFYATGAAHPGLYSEVINYDLQGDRVLALADLFKPNSNYLQVLSTYSADVLKKADRLFFPEGVEPKEENFKSWNITPEGLLITFDQYQVAPGAAGPQYVTAPYSALKAVVNPNGPIATLAK
jgi:Protein of unknown function (DUF3298)